jgi:hypothetical protein
MACRIELSTKKTLEGILNEMLVILATSAIWLFLALASNRAAYRNGANDGYGYSREPSNPGYRRAGEYLRRYCAHRWPELRGDAMVISGTIPLKEPHDKTD